MSALQSFLRMANLYDPQAVSGGMPSNLPVGPAQPPLINRPSTGVSVPGAYGEEPSSVPSGRITRDDGQSQQPSTLDAFRNSVLNPPQRTQMTYPKNTNAGLDAALKIAATPTDYEKNRVFVDGHAYQQVKQYTDPATGEKKFINKYKQPGFMEQVMKAMPAAASPAVDILNQPHEDAVTDWEMKNKGLKDAVGAESQMALARQRGATAEAIPERIRQGDRSLDIREMDAETRQRLSTLRDLPDSEKIRLLQEGKISLEEIKAANSMARTEANNTAAGQRNAATNVAAGERNANTVFGAGERNAATIAGAGERNTATNIAAGERNAATSTAAGERNAASIASRASGNPTQQKAALQAKAHQIANANPEWANHITMSPEGFPVIAPAAPPGIRGMMSSGPDIDTYNAIYQALYGTERPGITPADPGPPSSFGAPPPVSSPSIAAPTPPPQSQSIITPPPIQPGVQPVIQQSPSTGKYRISYDGEKTWRPYNPNGTQ